jgi:hypothetical protein
MRQPFSKITQIDSCTSWHQICDRKDIYIKDGQSDQWKQNVQEFMKKNYLPKHINRLKKNLSRANKKFGLSIGDITNRMIPSDERTRKGDLGEAVCCLSFEQLFGFTIPYYKWANKSRFNFPEGGVDVMAFEFKSNPDDDVAYPTEAKYRKNTRDLLQIIRQKKKGIIDKISNLDCFKICDELNFIMKRIEDNQNKLDEYLRVFSFFNRFDEKSKRIVNSTFFLVDSNVDLDLCIEELKPLASLHRDLKSYNHIVTNLEKSMKEIFEVITS